MDWRGLLASQIQTVHKQNPKFSFGYAKNSLSNHLEALGVPQVKTPFQKLMMQPGQ